MHVQTNEKEFSLTYRESRFETKDVRFNINNNTDNTQDDIYSAVYTALAACDSSLVEPELTSGVRIINTQEDCLK